MLFPVPPAVDTELMLPSEQGEKSHMWAQVAGACGVQEASI